MTGTIRVLVAGDHPLPRAGLRAVLGAEADMTVVGEAPVGYEALHLCEELRPDVLLLDLGPRSRSATEVVARVSTHWPRIPVVVLAASDDGTDERGLVERGARGYVLKEEPARAVIQAVHSVAVGGTWFSAAVVAKLLARPTGQAVIHLTPREYDTLALVAAGLHNAEIAERLFVSVKTVEFHVGNVLAKLGARSRTDAIRRARLLGLTLPDPPASAAE